MDESEKKKLQVRRALFYTNAAYMLADSAKYMALNADDILARMHQGLAREEKHKFGIASDAARRAKFALIGAAKQLYQIDHADEAVDDSVYITDAILLLIDRTADTEQDREEMLEYLRVLPSVMKIEDWLYKDPVNKENIKMGKSEFIKKIEALEHTKKKALEFNQRETDKVKNQYIAENCRLQVGDVVKLGDMVGTIEELDVESDGRFFGRWRKTKKDGEPFKESNRFYSFDFDKMEKVQTD